MTPTKADITFFTSEEAKPIQELWEPRWGDPVYHKNYGYGIIVSTSDASGNYSVDFESAGNLKASLRYLIFFPHQGQLQMMLEERGYRWDVGKLPNSYTATIWNDDVDLECEGPTPSIALGRALIEVLKEE